MFKQLTDLQLYILYKGVMWPSQDGRFAPNSESYEAEDQMFDEIEKEITARGFTIDDHGLQGQIDGTFEQKFKWVMKEPNYEYH